MTSRAMISLIAMSAILVASSCVGTPTHDKEWETAKPGDVGLDPGPLAELFGTIDAGDIETLHAVIVVRNGKIVFEKYSGDFGRDDLQYTASVSKSVGSILFGMTLADGAFRTIGDERLETPLPVLLPEYSSALESDPRKAQIRLRHILTMSAGFEWDEQSHPYSDPRNDWNRASRSQDPVELVLARPLVAPPGTAFNYNGGLSILLSYLVQRDTGIPVDVLARKRLFGPLGIERFRWDRLPSGITDTDGGLHLRPRDMAKLGLLFLQEGRWEDQQVVASEWVRQSTRSHVANDDRPDYGFQWWCGDFRGHDGVVSSYLASGTGGQMIFVAPALDLVVVLANEVFDNPMGQLNDLAILTRYVLPSADASFSGPRELDSSPETGLETYVGRYVSGDETILVSLRDGELHADAEGAPTMRLRRVGAHRFVGTVLDRLDVSFAFEIDDEGSCEGLRAWHGFNYRELDRVKD